MAVSRKLPNLRQAQLLQGNARKSHTNNELKMRYHFTPFMSAVLFSGCSVPDNGGNTPPDDLAATEWRVTAQIVLPTPATHITFVANSVAPWLGQIIYIDESRAIWRTHVSRAMPSAIDAGTFLDVYGLYREQAAGVFLAIDSGGFLKAFVEIDDDGNFDTIITSENLDLSVQQFCKGGDPVTGKGWLISTENELVGYSVDEITDQLLTLNYDAPSAGNVSDCFVDHNGSVLYNTDQSKTYKSLKRKENRSIPSFVRHATDLGEEGTIRILGHLGKTTALLFDEAGGSQISITDGLSVYGIDEAIAIAGTNLSFGSVYSDGLIILSDAENSRLVTVSTGYINSLDQ